MDKNSIIGLLLIGGILIGWMFYTKPSEEELAKRQQQIQLDSINQYNQQEKTKALVSKSQSLTPINTLTDSTTTNDSLKSILKKKVYGDFVEASTGENKILTLENDVMKVNVSTKGGRIASVELKKYKTFDGKPLFLFDADSSKQAIEFKAYSKTVSTDSLYFVPEGSAFIISGEKETKSLAMRLYAGSKAKYIEYVYSLTGNEYMMACRINTVGMQDIIASNADLKLNWQIKTPIQEKHYETQQQASNIYFKYTDEDPDNISDEKKILESSVKWIGFKQQFFTSVIIADNAFEKSAEIESAESSLNADQTDLLLINQLLENRSNVRLSFRV